MRGWWLLLLIGCVEPSYEGRLCTSERSCPDGYECGTDGKCHLLGTLRPDAAVPADAAIDASPGDAETIDATTEDAGAIDAATPDAGPALVSLAIVPDSITLIAGFSMRLTATAEYGDQSARDVTALAAWSVADPQIAEIDAAGSLTARAAGTTLVTAIYDGIDASAALSVSPPVVIQVETWNKHNLVVKSDGTVWGWGWNANRQLDPLAQDQITMPMQLAIQDVAWVRAGGTSSYAIKHDGSVWAWGGNTAGELGNGNLGPDAVDVPMPVLGEDGVGFLTGVRDLVAGYDFALALMPDGGVLSWGGNSFGSLGLGGTTNPATPTPTRIASLTNVIAIAAGTYHGVALLEGGGVDAWGYNEYGQLGSGMLGVDTNTPAPVVDVGGAGQLAGIAAIDAGWGHTLALTDDGRALAWGWDAYGQLGDQGMQDRIAPAAIVDETGTPIFGVADVAAGFAHSYARLDDGTVLAWGNNMYGQLGNGDTEAVRAYAAPVLTAVGGPPFAGTSSIVGGGDHGVVLTNADEVWIFGSNTNGELGNGMFGMGMLVRTPVRVNGL